MRMEYAEAVLEVVALIPAGAAVAYGDVAELLGSGGARQIGSVMSHHGSSVPWWRVLKASGDAPPGHAREALTLYLLEGTPLLGNYAEYLRTGEGRWWVDLQSARWAPSDAEFDRIDAIAERLERSLHKLSAPDDEMTA
ncbi:MGMT family protein [Arthrobacter sp. UYEF20]|uniref:MGMT family protein n=1 Tax=Arthrobacter sp. UYEF20 TaxID=1756363 RepID=UPI0033998544